MKRYFLDISYNGGAYCGWQKQPNAMTVQEALELVLTTLMQTKITVFGAGRTDAGVHARQLVAHLDLTEILNIENLIYRLNSMLPKDILVSRIREVAEDSHARFHAISRAYEYHISIGKNVFLEGLAHQIDKLPDLCKMNEAANLLIEYEDFQCFSRSNTTVKTYLCDIKKAEWHREDDMLIFTIEANRFLRNMVRAIVGTLLDVGYGKNTIADLENILISKNRSNAGASAPAHGLYLTKVDYPLSIFKH
jgi:tRNA pseudouridine38-40 synthase